VTAAALIVAALTASIQAQTAVSTYAAYTGTDTKSIPSPPALGTANSVIDDPTFASRILRVTDSNTTIDHESFISTDAGNHRAWNANSTAIKLTGPHGDAYWMAFDPNAFTVGDGSAHPRLNPLPAGFGATWEWSAVNPDIIYFLHGNQIATYNKSTQATVDLGGPPNGDPVTYMAVVIGQDNWVCAAAGQGIQDTYTEIYCVNPNSPGTNEFIDVYNKTINGVLQGDPNWPTSAAGQTIGIHELSGGTGASWLEVTFHQVSWSPNGGAVLDLGTNTWSLVTNADLYWSGHPSMGNGQYANSSGSIDGRDSRGMVLRNPDNMMISSDYRFFEQPPDTLNGWCDIDHNSWFNSTSNPEAPVLVSRFNATSSCQFAWSGEIIAAAVDGSNTVWRFAHNHSSGCYYAESFAQISYDGNFALFSSPWGGTLGTDSAFGCSTRIDTFIVALPNASNPLPTIMAVSLPGGTRGRSYSITIPVAGGTPSYTWSIIAGRLPTGLTLNPSTGVISGTPKQAGIGTSTFTLQVTDAKSHNATASLSLTIKSGH
jgi:hypothetical protein